MTQFSGFGRDAWRHLRDRTLVGDSYCKKNVGLICTKHLCRTRVVKLVAWGRVVRSTPAIRLTTESRGRAGACPKGFRPPGPDLPANVDPPSPDFLVDFDPI